MPQKIIIPIYGSDVAPRFDLATEVVITEFDDSRENRQEKIVVLSQASAEQLCHLILTEAVSVVICSGIEEEYYQYLTWKRVQVIDSVIGSWRLALERFFKQRLEPGDILLSRKENRENNG
jgi:predicted Fe-Mo cluster-binding NifX family protein